MTLEEFGDISLARIPTPREFIGFVRGQGWAFKVDGEKAWLHRVPPADVPVAQAMAAVLKREPYRTNVLRELLADPEQLTYKVERLAGEATAPAVERAPLPEPETCRSCQATVFSPGPDIAAVCPHPPKLHCPYFRLRGPATC